MDEYNLLDLFFNFVPILIGTVATMFWGKISKVLKALKELGDVISVVVSALEDKELSKEEIAKIKVETKEAVAAFKAILK